MLYASGNKHYVLRGLEEALMDIARVKEATEQLPDLPEWSRLWATDTELHIDIPYCWQKYREVRRLLGGNYDSLGAHTSDQGRAWRYLRHGTGVALHIILDPTREGSACERVKVGEKTVPIFDVRCNP